MRLLQHVCPSHIPLVQFYRYAKNEIWAQEKEKQKAELARQRHQARLERLEREQKEREAKLRQKAPPRADDRVGKLPIEAAVARARQGGAAPVDESQPSVAIAAETAPNGTVEQRCVSEPSLLPHVLCETGVGQVMRRVLYAMAPGVAALAWFFGWGVLVNLAMATVVALAAETADAGGARQAAGAAPGRL
jgi:hypothetical protein